MAGSYNLGTAEGTIRINYDGKGVTQAQQGMQQAEQSGKKAGSSFNDAGNKMAIAGGVIAAGIGYATTKAIDFEKEISAIGAVSDANGKQMDQLRQKALQLGADTQFSASEAATAMEELAKAGVSVPDILNGAADAATALAAAGGVDLPTAATLAANAMNSFNIQAKDLKGVVDTIAGAANASAIDVGQFGESLQQVGAVANLSGLSFHDTAVAIAEMGNAGIKGSDAGTSLKTFLQNLIPQTKQQKELFDQLGITTKGMGNQFFDASGKAKSLADISQVLQNATKGMSQQQKLATLQILFGSDAIRAAAVFADNGASGFNSLAAAMDKTSAADVAAARMNNAAGQIEQLKGSVETAGIAFGELLLPRITATAKMLTQFANWLNGLNPTVKTIILDILGVVSGLLLFSAALIKVVQFAKAFNEMAKAIKLYTAAAKIAQLVTKAWTAAQAALNITMSASVIGLIIIAILALAAAVYLVIKYHQQIAAFFVRVWHGFLDVVQVVWNWIKSHWPLLLGILTGPFGIALALILTHLTAIRNFIGSVFGAIGGFFANIGSAIGGFFAGIGKAIGSFFVTIGGAIGRFFQALFSPIITLLSPAFVAFWHFVEALFKLGVSIVTALWAVFWTLLKAAALAAFAVIRAAWEAFWGALRAIALAFWNFIQPYVQAALALITAYIRQFIAVVTAIWNALWLALRVAFAVFLNTILTAWNAFMVAMRVVLGVLSAIWSATWNALLAAARAVWGVIGPVIMGFVNGVVAGVRGALNILQSIWNVVWGSIKVQTQTVANVVTAIIRAFVKVIAGIFNGLTSIVNSFRRFFDQLHAAANGGTGTLLAFIGSIPGKILGKLGNLGSLLFNSGKALIEGFLHGIQSMGNAVYNAVKGQLDRVRNLWPFSPAKEGPFSGKGWTLYSGQSIMDAFAAGITDRTDDVRGAVEGALTPAQGALSDAGLAANASAGAVPIQGAAQYGSGGMPPVNVTFEEGAINVDGDGNITLDPKKVAIAANEGNRQLKAFAGAGAK